MDRTDSSDNALRDVFRAVVRHKRKAAVFFLTVMVMVTAVTIVTPKTYRSVGKLLVRLGRENASLDPTVTLQPEPVVAVPQSRESEINSVVEILTSRVLAEQVVDALGVATILGQGGGVPSEETVIRDQAVCRLNTRLSVEPVRKSNVIRISYTGCSPETSQAVVAKLIDCFLDEYIRLNRTDRAHEFFAEQAAQSLEELTRRQEALRDLKNKTGPTSLDGRQRTLVDRIGRLEDELCLTDAAGSVSDAKVCYLREKLDALPEIETTAETSGIDDDGFNRMRDRLYGLQLDGQAAASKYTEAHPKMQEIRQQIAAAWNILDAEIPARSQVTKGPGRMFEQTEAALLNEEALLQSLQAKAGVLRDQLAAVRSELKALNENDLQIAKLQREIDLYEANYRKYAAGLEQSRIDETLQAQRMSNIKVLQPATCEIKPIGTRKLVNLLLGVVVGVLGGVGLSILAEHVNRPPRTPQEIEKKLDLPVLALIPRFRRKHPTPNG